MERQILYKFSKMQLDQFAMFEENLTQLDQEVDIQTETRFSFDKEKNMLCSQITVSMLQENNILLKADLSSFFEIQAESLQYLQKEGKLIFPPSLLIQFASLCFGSIRGVIFTKTIGTTLNNFILPPVYFGNIIDKSFVVEG